MVSSVAVAGVMEKLAVVFLSYFSFLYFWSWSFSLFSNPEINPRNQFFQHPTGGNPWRENNSFKLLMLRLWLWMRLGGISCISRSLGKSGAGLKEIPGKILSSAAPNSTPRCFVGCCWAPTGWNSLTCYVLNAATSAPICGPQVLQLLKYLIWGAFLYKPRRVGWGGGPWRV